MFIQLKEVETTQKENDNVFIIKTLDNCPLYISRSFADHDITKYTSDNKADSIVYFNRQAAVAALKTDFAFTGLRLVIERIPVNCDMKKHAKQIDLERKQQKRLNRLNRMKNKEA